MTINQRKRVLVCPLGWGLGHSSRLIPIIKRFIDSEYEVIVAGDEIQMQYLLSYFPGIKLISFPSLKIRLSNKSNQLFALAWVALRLPLLIIKEHLHIKKIIRNHNIDIIISDNRYGLYCTGAKSVFITHQLRVIFPRPFQFLESFGELCIRYFINKYDYCWIPDYPNDVNVSGKLSHLTELNVNTKFIGTLSRFHVIKLPATDKNWDLVGISSGPSPQREILIDLIEKFAIKHKLKTLVIKGTLHEGTHLSEIKGVSFVGHLNDIEFANAIKSTKHLITRAGYSTIMDLLTLGISGLIVPTPGQTEQEYLAKYLSDNGLFKTCKQNEIENIDTKISETFSIKINHTSGLFEKSFQELISAIA